jgi:sarcosine oxidase
MGKTESFDVAVVGAGTFGAWTAWHLTKRGQRVLLLDAYGAANSLASSGGESRIIRMGYGADELYTQWSIRALAQWKEFFAGIRRPELFAETGVLWLAGEDNARLKKTAEVLKQNEVRFETMERAQLEKRYPQISFADVKTGILEPESGVLMARDAVMAVVEDATRNGAAYRCALVKPPKGRGRLEAIETNAGDKIAARDFVFACGSWLGKVFPDELWQRIFPTRQEVFFFGVPPGDRRFAAPALPTWLFQEDQMYGMPDLQNRGLKLAFDGHGERVDPDTQSRVASKEGIVAARQYVAKRFPAMKDAPIVEMRVCQYENTSNGDFLVDRHPELGNVWFAGGGSGHGFKHGPVLGEYVAGILLNRAPEEPRFLLGTKEVEQNRAVF